MQVNPHLPEKSGPGSGGLYRRALWTPSRIPLKEAKLLEVEKTYLKPPENSTWIARAMLEEKDVVIKKFPRTWKDWFRLSRGRRAWAAALTLKALEIPTIEPLGFLETRNGSFFVYEYLEGSTARAWIKPTFHKRALAERRAVADELLTLLLTLYRRGVVHGDTKAGNLLVLDPEDPTRRHYAWIDLESVRPSFKPSRKQILNNLVQLNGSIGTRITREDREYFREQLSETYDWAAEDDVAAYVERRTRERLQREVRREVRA